MTITQGVDPLRVQLERDRDRAVAAARDVAARGVKTFEDSATLEQHLDLAERSTARLSHLQVSEPLVYAPDSPASYYRDLAALHLRKSSEARGRLERHRDQMAVEIPRLERSRALDFARRGADYGVSIEKRALGNTGAAGGSGQEFTIPLWLIERWASVPRAAAPLSAACTNLPMERGWSTVSVPVFTSNAGVGMQTTQNTNPVDIGSATTGSTTSGVTTFAAYAIVAQQLFDMSPAGAHFDEVIFTDLTASAWEQIEVQVINGSGTGSQLRGVLNTTGITNTAYTTASPTGATYLTALAQCASVTSTVRKRLVSMALMHPRRYFWLASQTDSSARPLIEPGDGEAMLAGDAGPVGPLFAAIPTYITTAVPTNLGAATNQDPTILTRPADHLLMTSLPRTMVAASTHADTMGLTFRLDVEASFLAGRYPTATGVLNGNGTVAPAGY